MRIDYVEIAGFRSFGQKASFVPIYCDLTALVGPNAAGKTAFLQALSKIFGVTRAQRTIEPSDFHIAPDEDVDDKKSRALSIDVVIEFPELTNGDATPETIAPCFRHMLISRDDEHPACRIRLEAGWERDGSADGDISQSLFWIDTLDDDFTDEMKHPVSSSDRGLIQLYYTPATRDAASQIRATTGALAARLLRAIDWSENARKEINDATAKLSSAFDAEDAIKAIAKALTNRWSDLHDEKTDIKPRISLISRRFEQIVSKVAVIFESGPAGRERGLEALSDGQQSLFYFALAAAVFDLEREVVAEDVEGFLTEDVVIPALTIFAVEEPENHLSPFYLARIVRQLRSLIASGNAQAILSSHSPAVLSRVEPEEVRYFRRTPSTGTTGVKRLKLPRPSTDAGKYVREAVLAYPEVYFARFVILVEGDSERIVLPRLAEALDLLIDPSFVAIIPLGGRHVQHFWKLLGDLKIPYATLLDLDVGRGGGGFGRVKTAIENLIGVGVPKAKLLKLRDGSVLSDPSFARMHTWVAETEHENLIAWVNSLAVHNVFFSAPLDLDLSMLQAFPAAYEAIIPAGGGPKETPKHPASATVLGTAGEGSAAYVQGYKDYPALFADYRYHFLTKSKPATHLDALSRMNDRDLSKNMPPVLRDLLKHVSNNLRRD
ncbi:AAA family ATPase (plasmid) [Aliirhizobium terrae]|nr:AAA family ATPase [Rhizobium sp. CC-CFT758]WJH38365.1 AAA family ATPase [Rhizobium sp. CC-CFT758]